ncbi:MAG: Co2+/Mg2+ efflux protein ApaG, partial [Bacteroidota bacterium]
HSSVLQNQFAFFYHITIENLGDFSVRLLRRKWIIVDAHGSERQVEGEGVVGVQPSLPPSDQHEYTSSCLLSTPFGVMRGNYTFERLMDGQLFTVSIPEFKLEVPYLLS